MLYENCHYISFGVATWCMRPYPRIFMGGNNQENSLLADSVWYNMNMHFYSITVIDFKLAL